jgi:hypothetical protein
VLDVELDADVVLELWPPLELLVLDVLALVAPPPVEVALVTR